MLEQLINSLDSRGILVLQAMIGKRSIELLEQENEKKTPKKDSKLILPNNDLVKGLPKT